ncbi:putative methyltransferase-domain-containing protein [Xylariomycetidae sp. FL2044]|nr:putative methyltransferase-domain-containing protein [Xylariomycetidae sp. FL2044]
MSGSTADFPQVWQRPSYEDLLACLTKLQVDPPVWNPTTSRKIILENHQAAAQFRREIATYLSSIISSGLGWIKDDDQKETLWNEASRRLSERCGRAGMGEINRRWPFETQASSPFDLVIREPPITGDCLGLKTWGSSYLMALNLDQVASGALSHLLGPGAPEASLNVLELGSGTGLLGMAAASIWSARVTLSDLPNIVPNLEFNIEKNRPTIELMGGSVNSGALTWGSEEGNSELFDKGNQFNVILVADPLYDDDHPELLSSAIHQQLTDDERARAIVMAPERDPTTKKLITAFRSAMARGDSPLVVLEEHTLVGQDDWDEDDGTSEVQCWWAVFGRRRT